MLQVVTLTFNWKCKTSKCSKKTAVVQKDAKGLGEIPSNLLHVMFKVYWPKHQLGRNANQLIKDRTLFMGYMF